MATRLEKFIADQEAAVQIARDMDEAPTPYGVRVDAMNAALALANYMQDVHTVGMADVIRDAKIAEAYLKGESRG